MTQAAEIKYKLINASNDCLNQIASIIVTTKYLSTDFFCFVNYNTKRRAWPVRKWCLLWHWSYLLFCRGPCLLCSWFYFSLGLLRFWTMFVFTIFHSHYSYYINKYMYRHLLFVLFLQKHKKHAFYVNYKLYTFV